MHRGLDEEGIGGLTTLEPTAEGAAGRSRQVAKKLPILQGTAGSTTHGGRWLSLTLDSPGVPRVDGTAASARLVRQLSAEDFAHTYTLDARGLFTGKP